MAVGTLFCLLLVAQVNLLIRLLIKSISIKKNVLVILTLVEKYLC